MTARTVSLFALALSLAACKDDGRAGTLDTDGQAPVDVTFPDRQGVADGGLDVGEAAVNPDADLDATTAADGATDASRDASETGPVLCGIRENALANLAVKVATCLHVSPQQTLERMYRPEWWEGADSVSRRSCTTLLEAAAGSGCNGVMRDALKLLVSTPTGGTCASEVLGCTGHFATTCRNGVQIADDCEAIGGDCVASATAVACTRRRTDTTPCTDGAPPRCDGTLYQRCVGGVYATVSDCAQTLTTCDATNGCTGTGGACTGDAVTCAGTQLQQCRGGHFTAVNCGLRVTGTSCQRMAGGAFCGTDAACDPTTAPPYGTCEGNTLVLCAGGRSLRFDCRGEGFTGCGSQGCTL